MDGPMRLGAGRSFGPGAFGSAAGGPPDCPGGIFAVARSKTNTGTGRGCADAPAGGAGGAAGGVAGCGARAYTITWCRTLGLPARTSIAWIHLSSVKVVGTSKYW